MSELKKDGNVQIPLSEGERWAKNYRKKAFGDADGEKDRVTGYLIPLDTLKLVMDQDIDAVRAYKGINEDGEEILMFVGTKLNETTGIYEDVFASGQGALSRAPEPIVYDATRPVPPYGDPNSPMG